ncbi:MerR family transcriptional regulator [Paenibacillus sp. PK3_47]|uniref:MerR family transcriptional regulator n=1 Tax=Paenibacillus sp. PK3_47 TaxID=2072642 RepID=UPI00201DA33C|nr:MerR family transcriptional regulator [Paenibacillus sp. PK3_47]UQZ36863.1 MerR family transcriptional regulator [Paenibacillus sp. PK3_47]
MKTIFSIGEMSKLHNTTIQTLRYYDEIGLLVPFGVDAKTGYRTYSTEQFEQLNTIQYLKDLGFSLNEIKSHFAKRDPEDFIRLLHKQNENTEAEIRRLEQIRDKFQYRIEEIRKVQQIEQQELETVIVEQLSQRRIFRLKENIRSEPHLEISLRKLEKLFNIRSTIFIGGVGLTVDMHHVKENRFDGYNSIFLIADDTDASEDVTDFLPEGKYACIYYRGPRSKAHGYYNLLLKEIENKGLHIIGDAIERTLINEYISANPMDHVTVIQIPVK